MAANKFDVILWVQKTDSFPALRKEIIILAGQEPHTNQPTIKGWSTFTGASPLSLTLSVRLPLSVLSPPAPILCSSASRITTI
jgi:hypothetical protein